MTTTYAVKIYQKNVSKTTKYRNVTEDQYHNIGSLLEQYLNSAIPERRLRNMNLDPNAMDIASSRQAPLFLQNYDGIKPYILMVHDEQTQQRMIFAEINEDVHDLIICYLDKQCGSWVGEKDKRLGRMSGTHARFRYFYN